MAKPRNARNEGLAPSVTRVVICVSQAFCSTDQEKERLVVVYLLICHNAFNAKCLVFSLIE